MIISKMTIKDYKKVLSLWQNTEGIGLHKWSDSKEAIAGYLRRNPGLSLVACDNKKIIDAVLCGHDGRRGHLYHLAVAQLYRKKNGKALVNQALSKLASIGISRCTICAFAKNRAGRKFWRRTGWTERPDVIMMTKEIK
jgi:ribosomal protein S18 acetylase RimI-like enzyme